GVSHADVRPVQRSANLLLQRCDPPYRPPRDHFPVTNDHDPGGVVAPIIQALDALDQDGASLAFSDVGHDSTHTYAPRVIRATNPASIQLSYRDRHGCTNPIRSRRPICSPRAIEAHSTTDR